MVPGNQRIDGRGPFGFAQGRLRVAPSIGLFYQFGIVADFGATTPPYLAKSARLGWGTRHHGGSSMRRFGTTCHRTARAFMVGCLEGEGFMDRQEFLQELDTRIAKYDLLCHPFYKAW